MLREVRPYSATPRKREQTRRHGHVRQSRDLSNAVGLLAGVVALWFAWPSAWRLLGQMVREGLSDWHAVGGDASAFPTLLAAAVLSGLVAVAPVAIAALAATLAAHLLQTGFLITPPSPRRSTGSWLALRLSPEAFLTASMAALKLAAIAWAAAGALGVLSPGEGGSLALGAAMAVFAGRCLPALLALGALDYALQHWRFEQRMRMTRAELEAEQRETEGHPTTRARRRKQRGKS